MSRTLEKHQLIEQSIIKKYRKQLWNPFIAAVKRYELIQEGDRKNALSSWRISLSHRTTDAELAEFMQIFDACYGEMVK